MLSPRTFIAFITQPNFNNTWTSLGQFVKDLIFFVMNVCIIELVNFRIGLDWKDDLIKGSQFPTGEELFQYPDILNSHGYWGTIYMTSWQMMTVKL